MRAKFIEGLFEKPLNDLTIDDLRKYFCHKQFETSSLEFKSGDVSLEDIYKEITAFLNTEGGLIIIGAPKESKEGNGKSQIRYCVGELTYSNISGKDWLHQKIYSYITPAPLNIEILEFKTEKGNLFLIDIPQSISPPHQSNSDGRYYIRIENEAKPAPHGLVMALFDKRRKPVLDADFIYRKVKSNQDYINIRLKNISKIPAERIAFVIEVYNADSVIPSSAYDEVFDDYFGRKHSRSVDTDKVLANVIHIPNELYINHSGQLYIVSIGFWSVQSEYNGKFILVDPEKQVTEIHFWDEENNSIIDVFDRITNIGGS